MRVCETRPQPCVHRAKLELKSLMRAGKVPGKSDIRVRLPAEHVLVFRPALRKRIKAELGYDSGKGIGACDRGPSGLGDS